MRTRKITALMLDYEYHNHCNYTSEGHFPRIDYSMDNDNFYYTMLMDYMNGHLNQKPTNLKHICIPACKATHNVMIEHGWSTYFCQFCGLLNNMTQNCSHQECSNKVKRINNFTPSQAHKTYLEYIRK